MSKLATKNTICKTLSYKKFSFRSNLSISTLANNGKIIMIKIFIIKMYIV